MIILDGLDGLKQRATTQPRNGAPLTRSASSTTSSPGHEGILRQPAADHTRGGVILDLLFDPPRHGRLPINDDEIIDRALAAQGLAGHPVTLLTFDTGQAARASRRAGREQAHQATTRRT